MSCHIHSRSRSAHSGYRTRGNPLLLLLNGDRVLVLCISTLVYLEGPGSLLACLPSGGLIAG